MPAPPPSPAWRALKGGLVRLRFVGLVAAAAGLAAVLDDASALARRVVVGTAPSPAPAAASPGATYACPMHPDARRSGPGACPACGMPLQRREAGGPRKVALTADQKRLGGLALATVERRPLRREVSALATLELDLRKVARLSTPVRARVAALQGAAPGVAVRRGEALAILTARDLAPLARELQRGLPHDDPTVMLARERLLLQGLSPLQVERLGAGRDPTALELVSPLDGVLVSVDAAVGDQVMENASLLTVADLSHLVLVAWLPEEEALLAGPGTPLVAEVVAAPGRELKGTVSWVGPAVNAESRTLPVRALVDNPQGLLRPGMTGRARLEVPVGGPAEPVLVVPAEAVVETGLSSTVWREDASGTLEPVAVEVLARVGPVVGVRGQLQEGDRVVARGAFLLGADQRLKAPVPLPREDQD